jgi:hypothetical protein
MQICESPIEPLKEIRHASDQKQQSVSRDASFRRPTRKIMKFEKWEVAGANRRPPRMEVVPEVNNLAGGNSGRIFINLTGYAKITHARCGRLIALIVAYLVPAK